MAHGDVAVQKEVRESVRMILPLPDFALFRLVPDGGLYVRGFGQAFEISPDMKNSKHVTGNSPVPEHKEGTLACASAVPAGGQRPTRTQRGPITKHRRH